MSGTKSFFDPSSQMAIQNNKNRNLEKEKQRQNTEDRYESLEIESREKFNYFHLSVFSASSNSTILQ